MSRKTVYIVLGIFALIYAGLSVGLPPDPATLARYHLSSTQDRLLVLTIVIPFVAIWWAAFYGYYGLKRYSGLVKKSADGKAYSVIADGLGILAISLPISQITSTLLTYQARVHPGFLTASKIINGYMALAFSLAAYLVISHGVNLLVGTIQGFGTIGNRRNYDIFMLLFIVLTAIYSYLIFTNSSGHNATLYGMPDWLILFTIVTPYLYTWYIGFVAILRLHLYQSKVRGIVYRRPLHFLTLGIFSVLATSILLQFLTAVSDALVNLKLAPLLALLYLIVIVFSFGYILIAYGAKQLTKIEEV